MRSSNAGGAVVGNGADETTNNNTSEDDGGARLALPASLFPPPSLLRQPLKLTRVAREPRDDVVQQQPRLGLALGAAPPSLDGEAERRPAAEDPRGASSEVPGGSGVGGEGALGAPDDGAVAEVHAASFGGVVGRKAGEEGKRKKEKVRQ